MVQVEDLTSTGSEERKEEGIVRELACEESVRYLEEVEEEIDGAERSVQVQGEDAQRS